LIFLISFLQYLYGIKTVKRSTGQEVEVLVDKVLQPGIYEIDWDGNNYSSGIYFYRFMVTDPNKNSIVYNEIRKMVLFK